MKDDESAEWFYTKASETGIEELNKRLDELLQLKDFSILGKSR